MEEPEKKRKLLTYKTAIYARLSSDHGEKKSESLDSQITLLRDFIEKNNNDSSRKEEYTLKGVYADLGISGARFERSQFQLMMQEVQKGSIDCILVKDLSRFGRNYIETGEYLGKILPSMKVRFLAVCDGYDSFSENAGFQEFSVNIKNLVNDVYAKDIAAKSRAAKKTAQSKGIYVGGCPPYGYYVIKEKEGCRFCVDTRAAGIVREIFREYAGGETIAHIVRMLFRQKVHCISDYNRYHHVYCQAGEVLHEWSASTVRKLLSSESYCGDMVQHKYESRFLEGEKGCRFLPEKAWTKVPGTHEPIIGKELFARAKEKLEKSQKRKHSFERGRCQGVFSGLFYCGECKRKMSAGRQKGYINYYCRAGRYLDERKCLAGGISEKKLQKIVCSELEKYQAENAAGRKTTPLTRENAEKLIKKIQLFRDGHVEINFMTGEETDNGGL